MSGVDLERVGALLREVAQEVVMPRFCALSAGQIEEKAPGELVTVVDREAEQRLGQALSALLPGSRVVGEESVAKQPALLQRLGEGVVWLVDPLDGTANFIAGIDCFAMMIALLRDGEPVQAWMLDPTRNLLACAELGSGAYLEGERLQSSELAPARARLRGAVLTKYMPPPVRSEVERRLPQICEALPGLHCAGAEYPAVALGRQDFALFWRTLPWDHAPGALFVRESGGVAARFDGRPYRVDDGATGLLVAHNRAIWEEAKRALLED